MQITEVRIAVRNDEKLRAFVSITLDGSFVVRGMKIIQGADDLFVAMPSRRMPDGGYQDLCHPINRETRERIEARVIEAYLQEIGKQPDGEAAGVAATIDPGPGPLGAGA